MDAELASVLAEIWDQLSRGAADRHHGFHVPTLCTIGSDGAPVARSVVLRRVIDEARASGFRSVNLDLIYGLPLQTLDSFNATLDKVLEIAPDRIALYSYAHLPSLFKPQRRILASDLPPAMIPVPTRNGRRTVSRLRIIDAGVRRGRVICHKRRRT